MQIIRRYSSAWLMGWILGHLSLWYWSELPALSLLLTAALIVGVIVWCRPSPLLLLVFACLAGTLYATYVARAQLDTRIPADCEGISLRVVGKIIGLPEPAEPLGVRFRFQPERVASDPIDCVPLDTRWQLSWRADTSLLPGERWVFTAKLKRPHGMVNPGGFDVERWQHTERVSATGWVRSGDRLSAAPASIDLWRWQIRQRLLGLFPQYPDAAGTVLALLTGDRVGISPEAWERYARTGVTHLMAISGVHITLVAWLVGYWVQRLWRRWRVLSPLCTPVRMGGLIGWFAAGAYVLLAGAELPAQRTIFMLGVIVFMRWLPGQFAASQLWLTALAVVLLWDPLAILSVSLWLSFLAVGLLMAAGMPLGEEGGWRAALRAQWLATWGLLPLSLAIFGRISWISFPVNVVAIPVITFVVVPLSMLGLVTWACPDVMKACWWLSVQVMQQLIEALDWAARLPGAWQSWSLPVGAAWGLVLAVALLLMPRQLPGRVWCIFPFAWVFWPHAMLPVGTVRLTVFDVGQGLSLLLQTRHHQLLYDTGPSLGSYADAGSRVILPALREARIDQLDRLMFSHDDGDHTGGGASILEALPVRQIIGVWPSSIAPIKSHTPCRRGQTWQWDGVDFTVLWPDPAFPVAGDNNQSCVLRVQAGRYVMLFMGDLEAIGELHLLAQTPAQWLKADLLVLGHHGSKTSTTVSLLEVVQPGEVIAAVGYRNRFKHPSPSVVERLHMMGINGWRTDATGALRYQVTPSAPWPSPTRWRVEHPHYWRWPDHSAVSRASLGSLHALP